VSSREGTPLECDAHVIPREQLKKLTIEGGQERFAPYYRPGHSPNEKLAPYYHAIRRFVRSILHGRIDTSEPSKDGAAIQAWCRSLRLILGYHLPHICNEQHVIEIVSDHIHRVTILHGADHYGTSQVDERYIPMSISIPWQPDIRIKGAFSTPVSASLSLSHSCQFMIKLKFLLMKIGACG
jgi:hypothetical protein